MIPASIVPMEAIVPNIIPTETGRAWKNDKKLMILLHIDKIYLMQEHSGTFLLVYRYAATDDGYLIEDIDYTNFRKYLLAL